MHPSLKYLSISVRVPSWVGPRDLRTQRCWGAQDLGAGPPGTWAGSGHPHAAAPDLPSAHGLPLLRGAGGGQEGPQQSPGGQPTSRPGSCRGRWAAAPEGEPSLRLWGAPPSPHSLPVRQTDGEPSDILRESSRGQGPLLRQPGSRWRCCDGNQKEEKRRLACGPRGQRRGWAQARIGGREAKSAARPWPGLGRGPLSGNPFLANMCKLPLPESSSTDLQVGGSNVSGGPRPGLGRGQDSKVTSMEWRCPQAHPAQTKLLLLQIPSQGRHPGHLLGLQSA